MILTDAPNDFGGRFFRNCARTTPELPGRRIRKTSMRNGKEKKSPVAKDDDNARETIFHWKTHTMRSCYFAPDNSDLGSTDNLLRAVNEGHSFAEIESDCRKNLVRDSISKSGPCAHRATYLAAVESSTPSACASSQHRRLSIINLPSPIECTSPPSLHVQRKIYQF